ncbi:inhibitor of Bruton tyrosine kinase isoform X2 [Austrofundulus limnaeus]|uniref:Inhibitor of Bruton tyrosine kinase isoform X2 n=1 Tax=Austrofundulus limnaeus TaxID=52670 RepID=A0A2I4BBM6_AUSLI|nr:PREDICTED: inhibitor of Bruton tyrosine kinase-like isoform X2 [Austrofundulus limnaeus]
MSLAPQDCTCKCRSQQHAEQVIAALTSGSERKLRAFLTSHCHNAASLRDAFGRTALHLAASLGKKALLDWLLDSKAADLMMKDKESGWTALHRSAFYGHIHCLISLVKHGGTLSIQDKEGLSVLDLTMKDRPAHVVFRNTDPTEVYTWGNNTNFSLGHGNQESRQHPELVDLFARTGVYIKQVVLCKFHSVFLSQKGQVFTCGHGQGGRLGHGDEQTYLVPRMVEGLMSHHCSQVAAAKDHTVVLTEEGYVYTFGLNTFHQLGLVPPPASAHAPKQVFSKMLKGRAVMGVAAGRFHTVLWTREAVYTVGLNGGQLGYLLDPNGEKCVTSPRQVSALHHKDVTIAMAAASDGATVVVTEKGDVYLLTEYQCKKMASRQLNIKKVLVSGGSLDHRVDPQLLNEGGGEKVAVLALDEAGRVFCWRSSGSSVRQCRWAYQRQVFMSDMSLSKNGMMFVTPDGEGFSGVWAGEYKKYGEKKEVSVEVCGHSDAGTLYERIRLERLPFVHRAVSITMDSKGRNFGVLQSDPKTSLYEVPNISSSSFSQHFRSLLEDADEMDNIHDVTLQAGERNFPAHKYILSMRSEFFRKQFLSERCGVNEVEVRRSEDAVGCDLLIFDKIPADVLEHALHFIYTDSCELLVHGVRPRVSGASTGQNQGSEQERLISSLQDLGLSGRSALEVYRSLSPSAKGDSDKAKSRSSKPGRKGKGGKGDKGRATEGGVNPVKTLQAVAKKLGLGSLSARLDGVKYENGKIIVTQKKTGNKPKFFQKKCSYLCDVTLKSEDGKEFPCHKSVLCARLEYFNSMLGSPWIEATSCSALEMPTSSEVLQVILDYIYTDESPTIKDSLNVEFVCNVLVVADQLLITRLKEMCEVVITENLTLKNAAELLEFASLYNAEQLKLSCLQFIVLNMAALLESRALDIVSDEVLVELSAAYRKMIPAMQKRVITPYPDAPDLSLYEEEDLDSAVSPRPEAEMEQSCRETLLRKVKMKVKKKPRRRSDSSGGYTLSDIIQSPPAAGSPILVKLDKANSTESLQEVVTSDSEGSCMGVSSPTDTQSPMFHHRAEDDRAVSHILQTPPSILTPLKNSIPTPPTSAPLTVPNMLSCPAPAAPVLDLRTIMDMEASSLQAPGAAPKSPGIVCSNIKPSPVSTKLSQKQRRMLALASREVCGESSASRPAPPVSVSRSSEKTWATAVQPSLPSCSFRALLKEEENRLIRVERAGAQRGQGVQEPPLSQRVSCPAARRVSCPAARRVMFKDAESNEPERPAGPWLLGAVGSPPLSSLVTFASIVEEEKQQEAALIRSREKPLALIQIEERAIQDLLVHYQAQDNPDELIVVETTPTGPMAAPTWHKH